MALEMGLFGATPACSKFNYLLRKRYVIEIEWNGSDMALVFLQPLIIPKDNIAVDLKSCESKANTDSRR